MVSTDNSPGFMYEVSFEDLIQSGFPLEPMLEFWGRSPQTSLFDQMLQMQMQGLRAFGGYGHVLGGGVGAGSRSNSDPEPLILTSLPNS